MKIPRSDLQIEQYFRNWQNLRQHIQARYPISINAKLPRLSDHSLVNLFSNQSIWKPAWPFLNRSFESIWSTGNVPKGLRTNSVKKSHTAARFKTKGHMRSFKVNVEVQTVWGQTWVHCIEYSDVSYLVLISHGLFYFWMFQMTSPIKSGRYERMQLNDCAKIDRSRPKSDSDFHQRRRSWSMTHGR